MKITMEIAENSCTFEKVTRKNRIAKQSRKIKKSFKNERFIKYNAEVMVSE